ncbi:MAG: aminopeptidase [Anaerolineae bacterium]|nr:aminopeptidase [Anaerolineae bacterium]
MRDPRLQRLAEVIVRYSLDIQPGDKFRIRCPVLAAPLVKEVFREAIRAGAHVFTRLALDELNEIALREASDAQLTYVPELTRYEMDYITADLYIWAEENTRNLTGIDPKRMALNQKAYAPITKRFLERIATQDLRWCGTLFPTHASAQDAGMSLSDYEDFVFGAGHLNEADPVAVWRKVQADQQRVIDYLSQRDEIHIVAPGTDVTYQVGGRTWINCAGKENFPDGEVFTGPIENSVNGTVRFTYPAIFGGNEIEDVRLTFRDGKVVESTAARGMDFLNSMLDTDEGARYLGEVAFGLNYNIRQFTRHTLFDEKIGGTMHMALGASLPESGGKNESGIHWDMVCDLREGKVYADGQLCYTEGKFII